MSVAVLISGQMRTARVCHKSILAAFPGADFYVHAILDDRSDDAELFRPKRLKIEPQVEMPERKEYTFQVGRNCYGVQSVLKQLDGLAKVYQLYANSGHRHDWLVRCRADVDFTTLPETEDKFVGDIMVPKFSNFYGLNDRFAIIRAGFYSQYFERGRSLNHYIDHAGIFHPETFLAWAMAGCQIERTQAVFDTVRTTEREKPVYSLQYGDIVAINPPAS
jgi:hypothetical protein